MKTSPTAGPEPDFVALHKRINKSAMPQTDDPWGRQLLDSMVLLIKEELHHFWQVREMMLARDIPYVKITASNYARACGGRCVRTSR
ncbi:tRNA-(ms[2]io[6]A)-hydroxylase [Klebsiella variicola]|nr:tRNA-(ms[2]io[6]A)-hydroxylase [Klebsiella variicola]